MLNESLLLRSKLNLLYYNKFSNILFCVLIFCSQCWNYHFLIFHLRLTQIHTIGNKAGIVCKIYFIFQTPFFANDLMGLSFSNNFPLHIVPSNNCLRRIWMKVLYSINYWDKISFFNTFIIFVESEKKRHKGHHSFIVHLFCELWLKCF